jgi:hypothetical protein
VQGRVYYTPQRQKTAPRESPLPEARPTDKSEDTVDEIRISPAGDGFYAAAKHRPDTGETPHACWDGWVFLGFEGEDGEEVIEAVPCKRCTQERR